MSRASKTDLIAHVASALGVSKASARQAVEATLEGISHLTFDQGPLPLRGFAKSRARQYASRVVKGGLVGREVHVPARTALTFSANPDQVRIEA